MILQNSEINRDNSGPENEELAIYKALLSSFMIDICSYFRFWLFNKTVGFSLVAIVSAKIAAYWPNKSLRKY